MQIITSNVSSFTGLLVGRVYLIEDNDGFTLIDTSLDIVGAKILRQFTALGHQPQDIKRILITHAHPDHIGGLPLLKKETDAQVWCSTLERPVIEGKMAIPRVAPTALGFPWRYMRPPETWLKPVAVERDLHDGEILTEVMGGLQVIGSPGHAPGQVAFWQPQQKILFCGDVLMNWPNLRLPVAAFTVNMALNKEAIKRIAALGAEIVCFGHGQPLRQNAALILRDFVQNLG